MSTIAGLSSAAWPASGLAAATTPPAPAELGKGQKAAREFEAQLIGTVLQSLEKSFADLPGQDSMAGSDNYNYMGTQALAPALAAGGGFGIAHMISQHLIPRPPANPHPFPQPSGESSGTHESLPPASQKLDSGH